jgi:hypothetical protein
MHDHWLAIVAAATGRIEYLSTPTLLYRQHRNNVIGATRWGLGSILSRAAATLFSDRKHRHVRSLCGMSLALLDRCEAELSDTDRRTVRALTELWSARRFLRFVYLRRHGLLLKGLLRNLGLLYVVTTEGCRRPDKHSDRAASPLQKPHLGSF